MNVKFEFVKDCNESTMEIDLLAAKFPYLIRCVVMGGDFGLKWPETRVSSFGVFGHSLHRSRVTCFVPRRPLSLDSH